MLMMLPSTLSDDVLIDRIAALAAVEREATATLIAHLAELEARNLHLAMGFRSLFGYCRRVLHCSEHESYNRMHAVHAARRWPVILPMLADGVLHLTAVRLLAPHLRDADHLALLGGAIHKSKREVVALLAGWFPSADVPTSIRKLPVRKADHASIPGALTAFASAEVMLAPPTVAPSVPTPQRPVVAPLSPHRYRLEITIDEDAHDDLRCVQDLMRREVPDGDAARIVARALKLLRQATERKALSATTGPRPPGASKPGSRHIPAHVERAVWQRDQGQCAFEGPAARCSERSFLEFHHVRPWVVGGPPTAENIALRCSAHNAYEAAMYFEPIRAAMSGRDEESVQSENRGSRREPIAPAP